MNYLLLMLLYLCQLGDSYGVTTGKPTAAVMVRSIKISLLNTHQLQLSSGSENYTIRTWNIEKIAAKGDRVIFLTRNGQLGELDLTGVEQLKLEQKVTHRCLDNGICHNAVVQNILGLPSNREVKPRYFKATSFSNTDNNSVKFDALYLDKLITVHERNDTNTL